MEVHALNIDDDNLNDNNVLLLRFCYLLFVFYTCYCIRLLIHFGSSLELLSTVVAVLLFIMKEKAMQTLELIICLHVGVVIALSCIYMYIIHIHILFGKGHVRIKYFLPLEDECKWRENETEKRKVRARLISGREGEEKRLMAIKPTLHIFSTLEMLVFSFPYQYNSWINLCYKTFLSND